MKVAILIPVYQDAFCLDQCLEYLEGLNPQPTYYVIAENNSTDNTMSVIFDWLKFKHPENSKLIRLWFKDNARDILNNPYGIIGIMRQILLKKTRLLNVDYAIYIDSDIFIADKDFIKRMTKYKKDLVAGAYFRSYPQGELLSYLDFNKGKNKDTHPYVLRNYQKFKLQRVAAVSGGCLCISKKLINDLRVNFVYGEDMKIPDYYGTGHAGEDFAYCETARRNGYNIWVDDSFRICHYQEHGDPRPWRVNKDGKYIEFQYR